METNNLYLINIGLVPTVEEYIDGFARYENELVFAFIVAKSIGAAWAIFIREVDPDCDWTTKKRTCCIAKDVQLPAGIYNDENVLYPIWTKQTNEVLKWQGELKE